MKHVSQNLFKTLTTKGYLSGSVPWKDQPAKTPTPDPAHAAHRHHHLAEWILQDEHCAAMISLFRHHGSGS